MSTAMSTSVQALDPQMPADEREEMRRTDLAALDQFIKHTDLVDAPQTAGHADVLHALTQAHGELTFCDVRGVEL